MGNESVELADALAALREQLGEALRAARPPRPSGRPWPGSTSERVEAAASRSGRVVARVPMGTCLRAARNRPWSPFAFHDEIRVEAL